MRKAAAAGMAFSFSAVRRPAAHDHHLLNHGSSYYRAALFTYPFAIFLILSASLQACHAQSDDASALLHIKEAVGASSPNLASWNGTLACDATSPWLGVACNRYNRVVKLNMSNFHLAGVLPPEIGLLTSLTSLDISYNSIKSPLPKTFSNLIQMHGMNLSSNAFAETFPSSIVSMTNLVELRIDNNHFSGAIPEQISQLQQIEQMWMGNNSLTSLPKSLSSLPHMSVLTAWGNALSTTLPPDWGVWVNLTYLNLHNCYLKGILPSEWGQNFTKLQRLHLYENELTGRIPESWQNMKSLQQLKMKENELTGPIPVWVGELQQRNASVDFTCNYLTGPSPSSFNSSTWSGNCFNSDPRSHSQKCSGLSCSDYFRALEKKSSGFPVAAIIGIVIGVVGLCSALALTWWCKTRYTSNLRGHRKRDIDDEDWEVPPGVRRFTYREIMKSTKSFSKEYEIGEGGFGKVYRAQLDDGKSVAIKRASDLSFQGTREFRNEIALLSRLHHRHLVQLEGFCNDKDEQILVYEYMKNGNLHHHLFGDQHAATLNWYRRLEIALAVAQALDYLHTFADPPVIHRDVKPSNILLDDHMIAKVSDFGISKVNPEMDTHVSTRPAGTAGYLDPEYFLRRQLTTASDVYGYGVVLLELLTGQLAIDNRRFEDYNLVGWVRPKLQRKGIQAIIDPRLGPNYPADAYMQVAQLAVKCTSFERAQRPTMQAVASTLEVILSILTPPPEHMAPFHIPPSKGKTHESHSHVSANTDATSDVKAFQENTIEPR